MPNKAKKKKSKKPAQDDKKLAATLTPASSNVETPNPALSASVAAPAPSASAPSTASPSQSSAKPKAAKPSPKLESEKPDKSSEKPDKSDKDVLRESLFGSDKKRTKGEADKKQEDYKFWDKQPVPKLDDAPTDHGPIETKTLKDVKPTPFALPKDYEWSTCDMSDRKVIDEVYQLLCDNYVEDDDNMFRFDYSRDFLQWALKPPGFSQEFHVGVRATSGTKKLVGFITGVPAHMKVFANKIKTVEINFLCVHKKLRSKRLAPVLIKEITRRVNLTNVWQAVYTAGVVLPKPVAQNRYYHRSLNPKKLIEIGFSRLHPRMTLQRTIKLYKLPKSTVTEGLRVMESKDVPAAWNLVINYLHKFELAQLYTVEEFSHWFLPRAGVVNSYVVEDPSSKKITDFVSFYTLPSTIIGNKQYSTLKAAYSFYNVAGKTSWEQLMTDALILAKQMDFDVFNALNVMENDKFLKNLKFGIGDGHLQYYLYNWKCPSMKPSQVGLVLL